MNNMNTYFRSLYYGIALALIFVGVFGIAIDNEQWRLSVWLVIAGALIAWITNRVGKNE
jgi:hypothetical protein